MADGGGEGTKATTDEGAERSIQEVTLNEEVRAQENEHGIPKDACGRAGQEGREGVPRGETATPEVVEGTEAKSTDTKVGEERNPSERGTRRGAECETCNAAA